MRDSLSILGVVLQTSLVFGVTQDFSTELAKKIQEIAARRFATAQGIEVPVQKSEPVHGVTVAEPRVEGSRLAETKYSSRGQGLFNFLDLFAPAPVLKDNAFKAFKLKLDNESRRMGNNYYTVYFSVPREVILKYIILNQLQDYFEKQNYPRGSKIGSFMTYLAQSLEGPLRGELNIENLFESKSKKPILMRQRVFGPIEKFNAQSWPQLKPYVQDKTLDDLADFLNQYVDKNGYDKNIVVQLFIPKDEANDIIKTKVFGRDVELNDLMDTDDDYNRDSYAILTLKKDQNYDDLKTVVIHSFNGSFNAGADMKEQFAPIVAQIGAEMLATLKNPPAPLPRDTGEVVSTTSNKRPLDIQEDERLSLDAKRSKRTPPPPLPRDADVSGASAMPPELPAKDFESSAAAPKVSRPEAPLSLLEQIRLGKELKKAETTAKPRTAEDARVRSLEDALARAGVLESSDIPVDGDDTDDEWKEEEMRVDIQPQRPAASFQPVTSQQNIPAAVAQSTEPASVGTASRLQENLQELLGSKLGQRRGALTEDEDAMDMEDWDEE